MTASVISFIIITNYEKDLKIACPNCLDRANNKAMLKSALLGWWGFSWGIIKTTQALLSNIKMKKQNRLAKPNDLFNAFVLGKIGRLEANKNNPTKLQEIIEHIR